MPEQHEPSRIAQPQAYEPEEFEYGENVEPVTQREAEQPVPNPNWPRWLR
jgi:hypothetical protein